jgi:hypothetical protein
MREDQDSSRERLSQAEWRRIAKSVAKNCAAALTALEDERAERDRMIYESICAGYTYKQVAQWFQVSTTRVAQIVCDQVADQQWVSGIRIP